MPVESVLVNVSVSSSDTVQPAAIRCCCVRSGSHELVFPLSLGAGVCWISAQAARAFEKEDASLDQSPM
jgi:hypothetical protein